MMDGEYNAAKEMEKDYGNLMSFYPIEQDGIETKISRIKRQGFI